MPDTPKQRLQHLVVEASVTGSSQGVLSADLRRRIDAAVEDIKLAHIDALTAAVEGLPASTTRWNGDTVERAAVLAILWGEHGS